MAESGHKLLLFLGKYAGGRNLRGITDRLSIGAYISSMKSCLIVIMAVSGSLSKTDSSLTPESETSKIKMVSWSLDRSEMNKDHF